MCSSSFRRFGVLWIFHRRSHHEAAQNTDKYCLYSEKTIWEIAGLDFAAAAAAAAVELSVDAPKPTFEIDPTDRCDPSRRQKCTIKSV
jgi:hypothetical protein